MTTKHQRFFSEQLQLVLDEINGPRSLSAEFLRNHLLMIDEYGMRLVRAIKRSDRSKPK